MSTWSNWLLTGSSRLWSPGASSRSSSSNQSANRVLHGRVTKPAHTKLASKTTKYTLSTPKVEDNEGDSLLESSLDTATPVKQTYEANSSEDKVIKKEHEETDNDDDDDGDDGDDAGGGDSALGLPIAMMAQKADSEDSDEEPDPDTAWRLEQIYLNTILNARNEYTLMPSTWRMHFRGIPLPDSLFYIKTRSASIRPKIYARTDRLEYRAKGALALRKLIDVHARIQDIRDDEASVKGDKGKDVAEKRKLIWAMSTEIVKQLRRVLEHALAWAKQDGEIGKYGDQLPPNVIIMELRGATATAEPESEAKIQTEMCDLAEKWRACASNEDTTTPTSVQVPVLFGFVIMKHIITIVTLDASDQGAVIHVPCQLHMAERNQHQWNALAILVTICWARDVLLNYINALPNLQPEVKEESSDPDA
ncbi:hypothetical protein NUW58_g8483 [Xylaria curta]|uniref:Uncharacterized protein n=1 Tax=Xylaria curta TaxID=42375 RepID=A0ACC1N812_9PEZI|nr:hypothetical protein NUW58_g8483 [Xylaria curta]